MTVKAIKWPWLSTGARTGLRVQGFVADDPTEGDSNFEAIACTACARLHWVNPRTGRVLGTDKE